MSNSQVDHQHIAPEEITCHRTRVFPLYRVMLYPSTDEITYVTFALHYAVDTLTLSEAEQIALAAIMTGQAIVIVCPKDLAEYYKARLISYRLIATIEPDKKGKGQEKKAIAPILWD